MYRIKLEKRYLSYYEIKHSSHFTFSHIIPVIGADVRCYTRWVLRSVVNTTFWQSKCDAGYKWTRQIRLNLNFEWIKKENWLKIAIKWWCWWWWWYESMIVIIRGFNLYLRVWEKKIKHHRRSINIGTFMEF